MIPEDSRYLLLTEYNKLETALICSNGTMFQQEKTLLMVPLEVWIQPEYILGVAGFKELHSYGRVKTISLGCWSEGYNRWPWIKKTQILCCTCTWQHCCMFRGKNFQLAKIKKCHWSEVMLQEEATEETGLLKNWITQSSIVYCRI